MDHAFIFSHNLARILKTNAANVRRDLMLIGVSGDVHKGYDINELIMKISEAIDHDEPEKVAFIGIGELAELFLNILPDSIVNLSSLPPFDLGKTRSQLMIYPAIISVSYHM